MAARAGIAESVEEGGPSCAPQERMAQGNALKLSSGFDEDEGNSVRSFVFAVEAGADRLIRLYDGV
jgi:hypothetical protein